jgi:hypothetical protein
LFFISFDYNETYSNYSPLWFHGENVRGTLAIQHLEMCRV